MTFMDNQAALGLERGYKVVRKEALKLAAEFDEAAAFTCSNGYLHRLGKRTEVVPRYRTTTRQQTAVCHVQNQMAWIKMVRIRAATKKGLLKEGRFDFARCWNGDECSVEIVPRKRGRKQFTRRSAMMVTSFDLMTTYSAEHRIASGFLMSPCSGFLNCECSLCLRFLSSLWFPRSPHF